jgi:hypothetical protein
MILLVGCGNTLIGCGVRGVLWLMATEKDVCSAEKGARVVTSSRENMELRNTILLVRLSTYMFLLLATLLANLHFTNG